MTGREYRVTGAPVALDSFFGWLFTGQSVGSQPAPSGETTSCVVSSVPSVFSCFGSASDANFDILVEKFWQLESVGIVNGPENDVYERAIDSIVFDGSN